MKKKCLKCLKFKARIVAPAGETESENDRSHGAGRVDRDLASRGCAGLQRGDWPQHVEGLPPKIEIASVPFFAQEEYQCGPAALAMALGWSGLDVTPDELKEKVYTAALQGSLQPAMITGARRFGRLAYEISGTQALMHELAAGHPVIILQNLGLSWMPVWHYAVVIGYDLPSDEVILHSGRNVGARLPMRVFQNTWHRAEDWGLLVLGPARFRQPRRKKNTCKPCSALKRPNRRKPPCKATGRP